MKTFITTCLLTLAISSPSNAQTILSNCNTFENTQTLLTEKYGEAPFWEGLNANGQVLYQGWINQETGSWSLLAILPDGTACLFTDGLQYTFIDPPAPVGQL
jgi:hypothetical protein